MVGQTCPHTETTGYGDLFYFWTIGSHSQWMDLIKLHFLKLQIQSFTLLSIFAAKLMYYNEIIQKNNEKVTGNCDGNTTTVYRS